MLLGLEHQEHVHYAIPRRVMGYDYGACKRQYNSNAGQYKTSSGMKEDEFSKEDGSERLEGRVIEIVETGLEFGLSQGILVKLQKKLDISEDKAKGYLNMYGSGTV